MLDDCGSPGEFSLAVNRYRNLYRYTPHPDHYPDLKLTPTREAPLPVPGAGIWPDGVPMWRRAQRSWGGAANQREAGGRGGPVGAAGETAERGVVVLHDSSPELNEVHCRPITDKERRGFRGMMTEELAYGPPPPHELSLGRTVAKDVNWTRLRLAAATAAAAVARGELLRCSAWPVAFLPAVVMADRH
ncbi:hypothetical protein EYF80_014826 [Liparis tanakae]|uniref:Uncharacterized protein n=1 Tax=Liparis tanakae TaxID=230148 RepID=A0A4Z2IA96_9TELE|nr:hypothetical protein EYF80_014826 [Liparis tanakae]